MQTESSCKWRYKMKRQVSQPGYSEYCTWLNMHRRCSNPDDPAYKYYGARGISVCVDWQDFEVFLDDMGYRPKGLSLDRIDNNKGYFKENCRWATSEQQTQNSRKTRNIMIKGIIKPLSHWLKEYPDSSSRQRAIYEYKIPLHDVFEVKKGELLELSNFEAICWAEGRQEECSKLYKKRVGEKLPISLHSS